MQQQSIFEDLTWKVVGPSRCELCYGGVSTIALSPYSWYTVANVILRDITKVLKDYGLRPISQEMTPQNSQQHSFKVGDVVRLKSGGPAMTISSINADDSVYVQWFNTRDEKAEGNSFRSACLNKISDDDQPAPVER